jgi:hypothetical protein
MVSILELNHQRISNCSDTLRPGPQATGGKPRPIFSNDVAHAVAKGTNFRRPIYRFPTVLL